jgi:hypothetical protein
VRPDDTITQNNYSFYSNLFTGDEYYGRLTHLATGVANVRTFYFWASVPPNTSAELTASGSESTGDYIIWTSKYYRIISWIFTGDTNDAGIVEKYYNYYDEAKAAGDRSYTGIHTTDEIRIGDEEYLEVASSYPHDTGWKAILKYGTDRNNKEIQTPVCIYTNTKLSNNVESNFTSNKRTCFQKH